MRLLETIPEEYFHFTRQIDGVDISTIEQRALLEHVEPWQICGAVWAVLLSRHTSHDVQTFRMAAQSQPRTSEHPDMHRKATVHATVSEEKTFAEQLLDCTFSTLASEKQGALASISSVLHLECVAATDDYMATEVRAPYGTDLTVRLLATRTGTLRAQCRRRASLHGVLAKKMIDHYLQMLAHVVRYDVWSLLRINEIPMLSAQAELDLRQECLPRRSVADIEVGSTHQLFRRQAAKTPHHSALEGPDGMQATYRELDVATDAIAAELNVRLQTHDQPTIDTGLFVGAATIIGIMLPRSPAVIFAILACWKAGYAFVLLDPNQPIARLRQIVDICKCALVIMDPGMGGNGDFPSELIFPLTTDFSKIHDGDGPKEYSQALDVDLTEHLSRPAWIKTTSGSTGRPKCAVHSHAALGSSIASYAGRTRGSRTLLFFNPVSAASGIPIWTFLTNGGCICMPTQDELNHDLAGSINRWRADHICILPSAMSLVIPDQVPTLSSIAFAGESTPKALAEMWSHHASLLIGYGATEMNSHALPYSNEPAGALPPAQTLPNSDYSLYTLEPGTESLCPLFVPGEICLSTTYMSYGYLGLKEATTRVFVPHPFSADAGHSLMYRTGDLGMRLPGGLFVVLGRIDFQFKIDGNRISPEEIESAVKSVHEVDSTKVFLVPSSAGPALLTCCLVLRDGCDWTYVLPLIHEASRQRLPAYMIPHRWLTFEAFPKTPASKIDTVALAKLAKEKLESDTDHQHITGDNLVNSDMSNRSQRFLDIALRTLVGGGLDRLSQYQRDKMINQTFIANGGSSLLVLQLLTKLRSEGLDMELSTLYGTATLLQIASTIVGVEQSTRIEETPPEQPPSSRSLPVTWLHRLPKDMPTYPGAYQAIIPATMLQREMFMFALVDPKPWLVYQFLDLSKAECTFSQIQEAIRLLVAAKSNLRTVFGLLDVPQHPPAPQNIDAAYDMMQHHQFVQAILSPEALEVSISENHKIDDCRTFWMQDSKNAWASGRPVWRLSWLSKTRVLAWTLHHAIVDEWIGRNISQDLFALMVGIQDRDQGKAGWEQTLTRACDAAAKPSIEGWVISQYGDALDHSPSGTMAKHTKIWEKYMAGAVGTSIPDDALLPTEKLPAPPCEAVAKGLPYGEWCQRHHVTSSALFHVVNALTIARLLQLLAPHRSQDPVFDVTFYRQSSNRASTREAWEAEGVLLSVSPMRVRIDTAMSPATIVRDTLQQWIETQSSDPYYEDGRPTMHPHDPLRRRRPWGNVLFNYATSRDDIETKPRNLDAFPQAVRREDTEACYGAVWPLGVLEMNVFESSSAAADGLELAVVSNLQRDRADEYLQLFQEMLVLVLHSKDDTSIEDILQ